MTLFVAVDIGCIDCGEDTAVLGVFTDRTTADAVAAEHDKRHTENWHGQHDFQVFEVEGIDMPLRVEYK